MNKRWWMIGLLVALLVALLSPLASPHPDGLERVAEDHGFIEQARSPWYQLIPDYLFPGIENEAIATMVSGVLGTLVTFALALGVARWVSRSRKAGA
jgi:hypothetical protein